MARQAAVVVAPLNGDPGLLSCELGSFSPVPDRHYEPSNPKFSGSFIIAV
jgi:hypothetical protein